MVKDNEESWTLPQRKAITKGVLDRAIGAEEEAASSEHQAREAWFDGQHGTVMLKLLDGWVFEAEPGFIPSLQGASPKQLSGLRASADGTYLVVADLDLHINVDGLVTRIMENRRLPSNAPGHALLGSPYRRPKPWRQRATGGWAGSRNPSRRPRRGTVSQEGRMS